MSQVIDGPLICVCANQAWNLVNFRAGLIEALIKAGFRVLAVAPPDPPMEAKLAKMGASFAAIPIDAMGLKLHRDLATYLAIRRVLKTHRPAAWLSWTIKPNVYGSLAAGLARIPALPNVSGLGTAFIRSNLLTAIAKALYKAGFARASSVFFQNADDRDLFLNNKLVRAEQIVVLPGSGINPQEWTVPPGGRPVQRQFLMLARVVADKGVREFVTAAAQIKTLWPDARFRLMGELGAANRTAIPKAEVDAWVASGVIEYLKPVADVRAAIAAADFVVLPSYREGMSRVLLEAAAMGRPIVTTDVTGCRDLVSDGINGFLCVAQDSDALAQALTQAAVTDDVTWQRMSDACRARVVTEFSQERVTDIYMEALASAGVSPGKAP